MLFRSKVLEDRGTTKSTLYQHHFGPWVDKCPLFLSMTQPERNIIIKDANICPRCLCYQTYCSHQHLQMCPKKEKMTNRSGAKPVHFCQEDKCWNSVWVCENHMTNTKNIAYKKKIKNFLAAKNVPVSMVTITNPSKKRKLPKQDPNNAEVNIGVGLEAMPDNQVDSQASEAAKLEELFDSARSRGVTVREEPKGRPIFQFFLAKGKTQPVLTFLDTGCSDAVVREGIPGVQWEGVVTKKGPFDMGGVGGMAAKTRDEWMVLVPLADGSKQAMRCHSMTRVTADFPKYNTTRAVLEVKNSQPNNKELQQCKVPECIGGEIDCLLGIKYGALSPEPIHTLPNGLALYKSKLMAHDGISNAIIGGSHESFDFFAGVAGGVAPLIASFEASLRRFHDGQLPKVFSNPITLDEIQNAKLFSLKMDSDLSMREIMEEDSLIDEKPGAKSNEILPRERFIELAQDASEVETSSEPFVEESRAQIVVDEPAEVLGVGDEEIHTLANTEEHKDSQTDRNGISLAHKALCDELNIPDNCSREKLSEVGHEDLKKVGDDNLERSDGGVIGQVKFCSTALKVDTVIGFPPPHDVPTKWGREPANELVENSVKKDPPVDLVECVRETDDISRVGNPEYLEMDNIVTSYPLTTSMGR